MRVARGPDRDLSHQLDTGKRPARLVEHPLHGTRLYWVSAYPLCIRRILVPEGVFTGRSAITRSCGPLCRVPRLPAVPSDQPAPSSTRSPLRRPPVRGAPAHAATNTGAIVTHGPSRTPSPRPAIELHDAVSRFRLHATFSRLERTPSGESRRTTSPHVQLALRDCGVNNHSSRLPPPQCGEVL